MIKKVWILALLLLFSSKIQKETELNKEESSRKNTSTIMDKNYSHKNDCIFCRIAQGMESAHTVWEDGNHMAFLSIYPNTQGVTVVIPKVHRGSYIFDNNDTTVLSLMAAVKSVASILVSKLTNVGRVAVVFEGYGVDHLHAKLFPLHNTSGPWEKRVSNIDTWYDQYPGYVSSHDAARASDDVLSSLAKKIRE